jgi:xanthine dehydrogenase accessory factor
VARLANRRAAANPEHRCVPDRACRIVRAASASEAGLQLRHVRPNPDKEIALNEPNADESRPRGGWPGLLRAYSALRATGDRGALAIVVATQGSTYQKPGALVLLSEHGLCHGALSGGCLEGELERLAREVIGDGHARLIAFNTDDDGDIVFGTGIGCRGVIRALLLPLPRHEPAPVLTALQNSVQTGLPLCIQLSTQPDRCGAGTAIVGAHNWCWSASGDATDVAADRSASEKGVSLNLTPPPRLLLLGAGPETPALLDFARRLGWLTTVVDARERWAAPARAAGADEVLAVAPEAARGALAAQKFDAAVVMSHSYLTDMSHLHQWLQSDIRYIGLLGPTARRDALLHELGDDATRLRSRLHAPAGLDLGGRGPEAIALSIAAALQQHFNRPHDGR